MTLEFFVPMVPPTVTHQEKRVNWSARKFYEDDNLKAARPLTSAGTDPKARSRAAYG